MKYLFLDIDGVLNGYNAFDYFIWKIMVLLHFPKNIIRKINEPFKIKKKYVKRLKKIVDKTECKIIMHSSWRHQFWDTPYQEKTDAQKYLHDLFIKYDIDIFDITEYYSEGREYEIMKWLNDNTFIEDFDHGSRIVCILDDERTCYKTLLPLLVQTSAVKGTQMIKGAWYENTGLKPRHVKQAIKILNTKSTNFNILLEKEYKQFKFHGTC